MFIAKGLGGLAFLIPVFCSITVNLVLDSWYGDGFYMNSTWLQPLVLILSSAMIYLAGHILNSKPGRILIDPKTDEKIELKTTHSMFWIPMQYWAFIIIGMAILIYLSNIGAIY